MQVIDQKIFDDWKAKQTDAYGLACFRYAERWANLMEERMQKGEQLEDIAKATSRLADEEGITCYMFFVAVSVLVRCWKYGEDLRRWHNLDVLREEGEKANRDGVVLNPALLRIG